ncbi:hypothetical protein BASA81_006539 [Batrachochytrium salamandrivorans]|nr:hypothetical protein BASA81_006539 [Batrachochytrium salamandrivorans]
MSYIVLQNVPGLALLTMCFMGIFALPHYTHRAITGEYKRVGRDNWDYALDQRDARLKKERVERLKREQLEENDYKQQQQKLASQQ